MSMSILLHLLGTGLVLLLVRLGGGPTDVLFQAQGLGWLLIVLGLALSLRAPSESEGSAATKRWVVGGQAAGVLALVGVLVLALDKLDALDLTDEGRLRAEVLLTSLNALVFLVSWSVLVCVGRVRSASPVMLPL